MTKKKIRVGQVVDHVILLLLLCIMVYPLFMSLWCAFKSQAQFNASKWYPTLPLNFENLQFAVNELYVYIFNTIFVGGVGTLIASLDSLITFREYTKNNPGKTGYYVKMFSAFNFGFLILLTGFMMLWTHIF